MNQIEQVSEQLAIEWAQLQDTWQNCRVVWQDAVAKQFEKRFMASFQREIPAYLTRLQVLRDELKSARREVHS
jgi:hypothetical protein